MKPELKEKIFAYNRAAAERSEKARDLEFIVAAMKTLPPGQLKKVLTEEIKAVLKKYGLTF